MAVQCGGLVPRSRRDQGLREIFRVHLSRHLREDIIKMTAPHVVDPVGLLCNALTEASRGLPRSLLQTLINAFF